MKRLIAFLFFVILVATACSVVRAGPTIDIVSQTSTVWGGVQAYGFPDFGWDEDPGGDSYYHVGSRNVNGTAGYDFPTYATASSSVVTDFSLLATTISLSSYSGGELFGPAGPWIGAWANAETSFVFRCKTASLPITFTVDTMACWPDQAGATLVDLTDNIPLFEKNWSGIWGTEQYQFSVDPTHEYELSMFASSPEVILPAPASLSAALPVVPAPGAFMLGTMGASLVFWFRRRRSETTGKRAGIPHHCGQQSR